MHLTSVSLRRGNRFASPVPFPFQIGGKGYQHPRQSRRARRRELAVAIRATTNGRGIGPIPDTYAGWHRHVPRTLHRLGGIPADEVVASLAAGYPEFDIACETDLYCVITEIWSA